MQIAVVAGRHQDADRVPVVHLRPVGAGVEPVLVRVAGDRIGAGADVASAVLLMPDRGGEFEHVDVVARHDVLEHRPVRHDLVGHQLHVLEIGVAIGLAQLPFAQVIRKAESHVAARAGEDVEQQPKTLGTAGDVVEHHAGAVLGAQDRLRGEPDVLLPGRANDMADLAQALGMLEPLAQVVIGDMTLQVAALVHRCFPLAPWGPAPYTPAGPTSYAGSYAGWS